MIFAPALLLFTTLTSVGMVAAWAATSRWHWFVRTMLFLGAASLPLLIPAHEITIALLVLGATVAIGIQGWQWLRLRKAGERRTSRFSMLDVLLAVIPVASLCTVVVRIPPLGADRWFGMLVAGAVGGLMFLVGLWLVSGVPWNRWVRLSLAVVTALGAVLIAPAWGRLLTSLTYQVGWPTESLLPWERHELVKALSWPGIAVAIVLLGGCFVWAARPWNTEKKPRLSAAIACVLLGVVVIAPPAITLYLLATPPPIPHQAIPVPNGIDDFDQAAALLSTPLDVERSDDSDEGIATPEEINAMLQRQQRVADLVKQGLAKGVWWQVIYEEDPTLQSYDERLDKLGAYRSLSRTLDSYASSKISQDQPDAAACEYARLSRYASSLTRGGLLVDFLTAAAIESMGAEGVYSVRKTVSAKKREEVIAAIVDAERLLDDFEEIARREQLWSQHVYGWQGRLVGILGIGDLHQQTLQGSLALHRKFLATLRLLQVEYALLTYRDRHGEWPEDLQQLAPAILKSLPIDPCAPDGVAFRYRRQDGGYQLYSVWTDGDDDQGEPPREANGKITWDGSRSGDLSLGARFDTE